MKEADGALVIRPIHEIEGSEGYVALKKKIYDIRKICKELRVRSQPTMQDAVEKQVSIKTLFKELKRTKEEIVDPINKRKTKILDLYKVLFGWLDEANDSLGKEMARFDTEQKEKERKQQEKIYKKQEEERKRKEEEFLKAQKKLEEAQTEDEIDNATEQAAEAQEALEKTYQPQKARPGAAPKIRRTASGGSVSFTHVRKCKIVNFSLLPKEYKKEVADIDKINAVVKAGLNSIPGVRIWVEKKPITRVGQF